MCLADDGLLHQVIGQIVAAIPFIGRRFASFASTGQNVAAIATSLVVSKNSARFRLSPNNQGLSGRKM
jgi:hypothetical protein